MNPFVWNATSWYYLNTWTPSTANWSMIYGASGSDARWDVGEWVQGNGLCDFINNAKSWGATWVAVFSNDLQQTVLADTVANAASTCFAASGQTAISGFGASDPSATLSAASIAALDAQVNTLNSSFIGSTLPVDPTFVAAFVQWETTWVQFLTSWKVWFGQHAAGTGFIGGSPSDFFNDVNIKIQFDGFVGQFNELLRQWEAPKAQAGLALLTAAKPVAIPEDINIKLPGLPDTFKTLGYIALGLAAAGLAAYVVVETGAIQAIKKRIHR